MEDAIARADEMARWAASAGIEWRTDGTNNGRAVLKAELLGHSAVVAFGHDGSWSYRVDNVGSLLRSEDEAVAAAEKAIRERIRRRAEAARGLFAAYASAVEAPALCPAP